MNYNNNNNDKQKIIDKNSMQENEKKVEYY